MPTSKRRTDQEVNEERKNQSVPLLTREEEFECARIIEAGRDAKKKLDAGENLDKETETEWKQKVRCGEAARKKMILSNSGLVKSTAKKYLDLMSERMDRKQMFENLVQAGWEGLIKGVERFDYRKGYRLSTYAMPWIRSEMYEVLRKDHDILFTKEALNDLKKIKEAQKKFLQEKGREPSENELVKRTGFTKNKVKQFLDFLNLTQDAYSLEVLMELGKEPWRAAAQSKGNETGLLLLLFERYLDQLEDPFFCAAGTKEAIRKQCWLDFMPGWEQDADIQEKKKEVELSAKERKQIQLWIDQWHKGELIQFYKAPEQVFRDLLTPRTVAWILEQHGREIPRGDMRSAMEAFAALELCQLTDDNAPYRLISERCEELRDTQYTWNRCTNWLYKDYRDEIYDFILEKVIGTPI